MRRTVRVIGLLFAVAIAVAVAAGAYADVYAGVLMRGGRSGAGGGGSTASFNWTTHPNARSCYSFESGGEAVDSCLSDGITDTLNNKGISADASVTAPWGSWWGKTDGTVARFAACESFCVGGGGACTGASGAGTFGDGCLCTTNADCNSAVCQVAPGTCLGAEFTTNASSQATVLCSFRPSALNIFHALQVYGDDGATGKPWFLGVRSSNRFAATVTDSSFATRVQQSATVLTTNTPYVGGFVKGSDNVLRMYVNGKEDCATICASDADCGTGGTCVNPGVTGYCTAGSTSTVCSTMPAGGFVSKGNANYHIGFSRDSNRTPKDFANGLIDGCMELDTALTAKQMCAICSCGVDGAGCTCTGASYATTGLNGSQCGACALPDNCSSGS